jgi:NAD(P)-dependent dehydrogenase (short-subunit alcohol dehydrogenase family)
MKLEGRKALVFGGTSGIGLATVVQLVDAGVTVVAVSRNPSRAESLLPPGVKTVACDVTDEAAVAALCAEEAPYDILISAATGGDRAIGPFLSMDMDGFKGSFDKLWGYANVVRHGTAHLPDDGSVVLVSGSPARRCKLGQVALSSVGGSVEALARAIAPEIAPKRINVVSPGTIDTPMVALQGDERDALYKNMTANNLIPRAGAPEEVASALIFLIQNEFVTGTTIDVDGGWLLS